MLDQWTGLEYYLTILLLRIALSILHK